MGWDGLGWGLLGVLGCWIGQDGTGKALDGMDMGRAVSRRRLSQWTHQVRLQRTSERHLLV